MRVIPVEVERKLNDPKQTSANNSDPNIDLIISRPNIPLLDEKYVQAVGIRRDGHITDVSVAIPHTRGNGRGLGYIAYVSNGVGYVMQSPVKMDMNSYNWIDVYTEFSNTTSISVAYNGELKTFGGSKYSEFITEEYPWLLYASGGNLYARKMNSGLQQTLASGNVTKVSAIASPYWPDGYFNYGFVAFFIMDGKIYYRQLIDNEWYDAIQLTKSSTFPNGFGPEGKTWTDIGAFRTYDYRVGLQAKASDGTVYEFFTQYMDFGTKGSEHFSINRVSDKSYLVKPLEPESKEHIEFNNDFTMAPNLHLGERVMADEHFEIEGLAAASQLREINKRERYTDEHFEINSVEINKADLIYVEPI